CARPLRQRRYARSYASRPERQIEHAAVARLKLRVDDGSISREAQPEPIPFAQSVDVDTQSTSRLLVRRAECRACQRGREAARQMRLEVVQRAAAIAAGRRALTSRDDCQPSKQ